MRFFAIKHRRPILICGAALTLAAFSGTLTTQASQDQEPDVTRSQIAIFDAFLDAHPDIDRQLQSNPALVKNHDYLEDHPELQNFLNQHPNVRNEVNENPSYFMERERRLDARERGRNQNPDLTTREVASADRFLDAHPDIDKQLRANPSLINNAEYLENHPQLADYLNQHPEVREEWRENPNYFMRRESRFDRAEARRDKNPNPDLTNQELASMDRFLDKHKNIAKDLDKNPALVNDQDYLKHHKDLRNYLGEHPAVHEEIAENPSFFMHREDQFDALERDRDRDRDRDAGRRATPEDRDNPDLTNAQLKQMDDFLDKHKKIDKDLRKDPSRINDQRYLDKHKDLRTFMAENPKVQEEFKENPRLFMQREAQFERSRRLNRKPIDDKTRFERKEDTHLPRP